jgi:hypothetical protein
MSVKKFSTSNIIDDEKTNKFWDQKTVSASSDMELISTNILSTNQSSVTFSNLNTLASAYRHLRVVALVRAATNATAQSIVLELNGSTAANYNAHSFYTFKGPSTLIANSWLYVNQPSSTAYIGGAEGSTSVPNLFQPNIYEFHDFSQSDKNKYVTNLNGCYLDSNNGSVAFNNLMWNQTSPITSIKFSLASNFQSGSRFSLYGIK